jgi:hypothetical protein
VSKLKFDPITGELFFSAKKSSLIPTVSVGPLLVLTDINLLTNNLLATEYVEITDTGIVDIAIAASLEVS